MTSFRRYVAIGDSSTEGLEDPDRDGGYRGWADRLAQIVADAQDDPLDYANLAVRSLRLNEIRLTQFDAALAMHPDLLSVFGGANDLGNPARHPCSSGKDRGATSTTSDLDCSCCPRRLRGQAAAKSATTRSSAEPRHCNRAVRVGTASNGVIPR